MRLLKEYIRQILRESEANLPELAAVVVKHNGRHTATLYDPSLLSKYKSSFENRSSSLSAHLATAGAIKGFIDVGPPSLDGIKDRCYDAWMVYRAAGHDYGRYIYGIAYALSPSGKLISDRTSVSSDAIDGWSKQKAKRSRNPLDDSSHEHKTTINQHHSPDPHDDCPTYDTFEEYADLNFAYDALPGDKEILTRLTAAHETTFDAMWPDGAPEEFAASLPSSVLTPPQKFFKSQVESIIASAGNRFFWINYDD